MESGPSELWETPSGDSCLCHFINDANKCIVNLWSKINFYDSDVKFMYNGKSEQVSDYAVETVEKNYHDGHSQKTVKMLFDEVEFKIHRDRNGEYEPQIINKYNRNTDGMAGF